jgi:hypothetical protein
MYSENLLCHIYSLIEGILTNNVGALECGKATPDSKTLLYFSQELVNYHR